MNSRHSTKESLQDVVNLVLSKLHAFSYEQLAELNLRTEFELRDRDVEAISGYSEDEE